MGCMCAKPLLEASPKHLRPGSSGTEGLSTNPSARTSKSFKAVDDVVLTPKQLLEFSEDVVTLFPDGNVTPVSLAAVALIESSGRAKLVEQHEDIGEPGVGVCQVHLSTARWLAQNKSYNKYGLPEKKDLQDPIKCLYYCAAYLTTLSNSTSFEDVRIQPLLCLDQQGGQEDVPPPIPDIEEFAVRAYHGGPKSWQGASTLHYWNKYVRARKKLLQLHEALRVFRDSRNQNKCTMHVVHNGETLAKISNVCGVSIQDILAANPDLADERSVQTNDCIALPVSVVLPRMHAIRPGETVQGIAKAYGVSVNRLMSVNPEIKDPKVFEPGWVLALPGLRGESSSNPDSHSRSHPPQQRLVIPGISQARPAQTLSMYEYMASEAGAAAGMSRLRHRPLATVEPLV